MTFNDIVMGRHATKSFDGRKVPADQVEALQDIIRFAATSYNVQPWRAVVIDNEARKQALVEAAYNQPQINSCSHLFVFCANTDLDSLVDRLEAQSGASGMPAEQVEAYISTIRAFADGLEGDQRLSWAQRQTYLALGNGINGAKALGFDSCPMEGFDPNGFAEVLELPDTLVPTVLMPIGYAESEPRPKIRFARDEMFFNS
jgi:nitroreductase